MGKVFHMKYYHFAPPTFLTPYHRETNTNLKHTHGKHIPHVVTPDCSAYSLRPLTIERPLSSDPARRSKYRPAGLASIRHGNNRSDPPSTRHPSHLASDNHRQMHTSNLPATRHHHHPLRERVSRCKAGSHQGEPPQCPQTGRLERLSLAIGLVTPAT